MNRRMPLCRLGEGLMVLFMVATGSLYASRLNPVSWSLSAEQPDVAPGSTVVLRLHAQITAGYHLYSFTTPGGGPIKTKASLLNSAAIKTFRVYQPKPDHHLDPTLKVPVETFENQVDFLIPTTLSGDASDGDKIVIVSVRYQACSSEICLAPVTKTAMAHIMVQRGAASKRAVTAGYQLVG